MGENANVHEGGLSVLLFLLSCVTKNGDAVWLNLPTTGSKCVSEELHDNVVVLADYVVFSNDPPYSTPTISSKVTSPCGNTLHQSQKVTDDQFAFTTTEPGSYLACFWLEGHEGCSDISVYIDWKTGIAAKDWESIARKEKIEGIEFELTKLEGAVEAIDENLLHLKFRESDLRSMSERTNTRVA